MIRCITDLLAGQLEQTVTRSFIRTGRLKQWLTGENCPSSIQGCKVLLQSLFSSIHDVPDFEDMIPHEEVLSQERQPRTFHARIAHDGVFFTRSSTHLGNSLIQYYPNGNRFSSPIPGQIDHIFSQAGQLYFAINRHLPVEKEIIDPFQFYPHLPIKLYSTKMSTSVEIVEVGPQIVGHVARWNMTPHEAAIVSLSRVRL
jgi:hypothetical protein